MKYEYMFVGRKPTRLQVRKKLMEALGMGEYDIEIMWGENGVQFAKWDTGLRVYGWIKNISGADLAKDGRVLCYLSLLNRRLKVRENAL